METNGGKRKNRKWRREENDESALEGDTAGGDDATAADERAMERERRGNGGGRGRRKRPLKARGTGSMAMESGMPIAPRQLRSLMKQAMLPSARLGLSKMLPMRIWDAAPEDAEADEAWQEDPPEEDWPQYEGPAPLEPWETTYDEEAWEEDDQFEETTHDKEDWEADDQFEETAHDKQDWEDGWPSWSA